jgi:soluble lytic murein transglycosylase-like protein
MVGLLVAAPSWACWDEAAARYGLSSHLLYAIARTESGLNPAAVGRNRDGSRDIGLMQINSSWLPTLASHGIAEHHLFDACTSIHVGAWILAGNVSRLGYTWEAVGAYNARSASLRRAYAHRVHRALMAGSQGPGVDAAPRQSPPSTPRSPQATQRSQRSAAPFPSPSPARVASASQAGPTQGLVAQ